MWIYTLIDYTTGTPVTTAIVEPVYWDKLTIKYNRDKKYHGFFDFLDDSLASMQFRNFTNSPAFDILTNAYDTDGAEAEVHLNLSYQCNPSSAVIDLYTARLDFTRYDKHEGLEGCFVEVGGMNASAYFNFKNRIDQAVNLNSLVSFDKAAMANQNVQQADLIRLQTAYQDFNGSFSTLVGSAEADLNNAIAGGVGAEIIEAYVIVACVAAAQAATIAGAPNLSGDNANLSQATSFGLSEQEAPDVPTANAIAAAAATIQASINGLVSPTTEDIVDVIYTYITANALATYGGIASTTGVDATAAASVYAAYAVIYASVMPTGDLPNYPGLGFELPLLIKNITYAEYWTGAYLDVYCQTLEFPSVLISPCQFSLGLNLTWDDLTGGASTSPTIFTGSIATAFIWTCPADGAYIFQSNFVGTWTDTLYDAAGCTGATTTGLRGLQDLGGSGNTMHLVAVVIHADGSQDPPIEIGSFSPIPFNYSAASVTYAFSVVNTQSVNLIAGDAVYYLWYCNYEVFSVPHEQSVQFMFSYTAKSLYIKKVTTFPASNGQVFFVLESLSRIAESLTEMDLKVYSDYFGRPDALPYASPEDGCGALECISNGRFIRQALVAADGTLATMSISFSDLFRDLDGIHRLGMGLEDDPNRTGYQLLRVESEDYFYQDTVLLTLPNVGLLSTAHDGAADISTIDLGYPNWQCWTINGLDEWNTERKYRTTLQSITNTKDITCKFVTSGYAIEFTRRQGGGSSDWRYDNMNFLICLRRTSPVQLPPFIDIAIDGFNLDTTTAVNILPENQDPTYNARISPARIALNWIKAIFRSYQNYLDGQLVYTWGDGNYLAKYQPLDPDLWACEKTASLLGENQLLDYTVFDTPSDNYPLFRNELVTFEYPLSIDQFLIIKANPYGLIGYSVNSGSTRYGWIEQMSYTPQIDGSSHAFMAKFTLRPKIS